MRGRKRNEGIETGYALKYKLRERVGPSVMKWNGQMEKMSEEGLAMRICRAGVAETEEEVESLIASLMMIKGAKWKWYYHSVGWEMSAG